MDLKARREDLDKELSNKTASISIHEAFNKLYDKKPPLNEFILGAAALAAYKIFQSITAGKIYSNKLAFENVMYLMDTNKEAEKLIFDLVHEKESRNPDQLRIKNLTNELERLVDIESKKYPDPTRSWKEQAENKAKLDADIAKKKFNSQAVEGNIYTINFGSFSNSNRNADDFFNFVNSNDGTASKMVRKYPNKKGNAVNTYEVVFSLPRFNILEVERNGLRLTQLIHQRGGIAYYFVTYKYEDTIETAQPKEIVIYKNHASENSKLAYDATMKRINNLS